MAKQQVNETARGLAAILVVMLAAIRLMFIWPQAYRVTELTGPSHQAQTCAAPKGGDNVQQCGSMHGHGTVARRLRGIRHCPILSVSPAPSPQKKRTGVREVAARS